MRISMTPVVTNLLILNGLFFLATVILESKGVYLDQLFALHHWNSTLFRPHQFITMIFMHADFQHLLGNMFLLFLLGRMIEREWGGKRFLIFFLITGFGSGYLEYAANNQNIQQEVEFWSHQIEDPDPEALQAAILYVVEDKDASTSFRQPQLFDSGWNFYRNHYQTYLTDPNDVEVQNEVRKYLTVFRDFMSNRTAAMGASGAIYGLAVAFALMFGRMEIRLMFLIPIQAQWLILIYMGREVLTMIQGIDSNVGHWGHLGGAIFGFILLKLWDQKRLI